MKLTIEKAAASLILGAIAPAIATRQVLPILAHIRLEAQGDALSVTASDLDVWLTAVAGVRGQVSGAACIEGRRMLDIARVLPDGAEIEVDTDTEARAIIKGGRSRFLVGQLPPADFPTLQMGTGDTLDIPAADLLRMLNIGAFCMGEDKMRIYLAGAYLHAITGKLAIVSTNGQRLSACYSDIPFPEETKFILPSKAVAILQKMLTGFEGDVEVMFDGQKVRFIVGSTTFVAKVIDGSYPDYELIIPKTHRGAMTADTDLLMGAVDRAMIAHDERTSRILLEIDGANLICSAGDPVSGAQGRDEMEVDWTGSEPMTVACNGRWLREMLGYIEGENTVVKIGADKSPVLTISETGAPKWLAVLAPHVV